MRAVSCIPYLSLQCSMSLFDSEFICSLRLWKLSSLDLCNLPSISALVPFRTSPTGAIMVSNHCIPLAFRSHFLPDIPFLVCDSILFLCVFWTALNFDVYTHFTSPIRRYADVLVHRMLQYSIDIDNQQRLVMNAHTESKALSAPLQPEFVPHKVVALSFLLFLFLTLPCRSYVLCVCVCVCILIAKAEVASQAKRCNVRKLNARKAQEQRCVQSHIVFCFQRELILLG